jgi:hypothetical protein
MSNLHHLQTGKDQIHVAHAFAYADEAARLADTSLDSTHLHKLFLELSTAGETGPTLWMLTALSPITWKRVGAAPPPTFPAGTRMLFQQSTAPTGWTKDVSINDRALRVVSGAVGLGGSVNFSTLFARTAVDSMTLVASQMPSHAHSTYINSSLYAADIQGLHVTNDSMDTTLIRLSSALSVQTTSQGGNGSHTHGLDLRLAYVDVIIARKD